MEDKHNHECGCNHEHHGGDDCSCHDHEHETEEYPVITLDFEDGPQDFGVLEVFEFEDKEYIVVMTLPEDESDSEVYIFEYEEVDSENFEVSEIESDEEYDRVAEYFQKLISEN
ncbi:MAG: DUF1292 domain-containing protein [Ezakiella sp.]|nr:DUF1292 domain-containing protein [Ezakiella sp.]MDD7761845.1 DUF1292 domain-containing protein [Bacillota bacterium]MDY3946660.1 DUF1292 domain-containing protein [Ezakiella sp.]